MRKAVLCKEVSKPVVQSLVPCLEEIEVRQFEKILRIDLPDVFAVLEAECVEKFEKSWQELLSATQEQLDTATK